jgi:hypothetical protein
MAKRIIAKDKRTGYTFQLDTIDIQTVLSIAEERGGLDASAAIRLIIREWQKYSAILNPPSRQTPQRVYVHGLNETSVDPEFAKTAEKR